MYITPFLTCFVAIFSLVHFHVLSPSLLKKGILRPWKKERGTLIGGTLTLTLKVTYLTEQFQQGNQCALPLGRTYPLYYCHLDSVTCQGFPLFIFQGTPKLVNHPCRLGRFKGFPTHPWKRFNPHPLGWFYISTGIRFCQYPTFIPILHVL